MEVWVLTFYIVFGDSFRGGEYISADPLRAECACPARALEGDLQAPDHLALSADHSVKDLMADSPHRCVGRTLRVRRLGRPNAPASSAGRAV